MTPHRSMMYAACLQITGNQHDAEDALQIALLAAWQHIGAFEGRSALSTWLYRIAHNAALALVRRRVPQPAEDVAEQLAPVARHPGEVVSDVELVRWALQQLPLEFRGAIVLRECCGLSYQEIADALGIKIDTVKSRISRARQALATLLADDP